MWFNKFIYNSNSNIQYRALINKKNIVLYDEKSKEKYGKPKKSAKFNKALNEIETDHKKVSL